MFLAGMVLGIALSVTAVMLVLKLGSYCDERNR